MVMSGLGDIAVFVLELYLIHTVVCFWFIEDNNTVLVAFKCIVYNLVFNH